MNPTNLEIDQIQKIIQDEVIFNLIKRLFNQELDFNIPKVNDIDNDNTLGQKYRAYIEAKDLIQTCFRKLEYYKINKKLKEDLNKAR